MNRHPVSSSPTAPPDVLLQPAPPCGCGKTWAPHCRARRRSLVVSAHWAARAPP